MKPKDIFLQNILAKIKVWQDAYDFNKSLPDDVFESLLNGSNGHKGSIEEKHIPLAKEENNNLTSEGINAYGAKSQIIKDFIASKQHGVEKSSIISYLQTFHGVEKKKAVSMATNTITSLIKGNEIEAFKRGKYRIKKTKI